MEDLHELVLFDEIYRDYLDQVSQVDVGKIKDRLGVMTQGDEAIIPLFGMEHRIGPQGISNHRGSRPSHSVSVVLCKYLLMCPDTEPWDSRWVSYRDFKDAGPFVQGFRANAEANISRTFSGRMSMLEHACGQLSGCPVQEDFPSDLRMRFDALPKVPILMLFNDQDDEFPAQCSLLFERRAQEYLDMECLAMAGWILAEWLKLRV